MAKRGTSGTGGKQQGQNPQQVQAPSENDFSPKLTTPPNPPSSGNNVTEIETRSLPPQGQADPNVRKPPGVQAAASLAEEIWHATYQGSAEAEPTTDAEPPDDPAASAEPEEPQQEQAPPDTTPDPWENRYNSMRGRYDQAVEQNRSLLNRLTQLERQVQQASPQIPLTQAPAAPPQNTLLTAQEREEYGPEFLDIVARQARENINPELTFLKTEVQKLRQQLGSVGTHIQMDSRGRMEADLDQTLPEWRDINMEQDFLDWLQLPDAYSGVIRHNLLRQAFDANQTPRVLAFFQGFLAEATASRPVERQPAPVAAQPPQPRMDLASLAAPGRGRSAAAPQSTSADKPLISRADISHFYDDVRAGRYAGRPQEKTQIEQQLMDAQREGRII